MLILVLVAILATAAPADARTRTYGDRLGSHSMLYLNSKARQHEALFRAASEAGLRYLRMDFAIGLIFRSDGTDFSAVDRVNALAAKYRLKVLGVITETPWYISGCRGLSFDVHTRCAPAARHEATWRAMVYEVVRRAGNVRHWELGNEPNDPRTFVGSPSDYARWAALAAAGIRAARPNARIAVGGFSHLDRSYIRAVLHDRANPLIDRIDVANLHVRGALRSLRGAVSRARVFFRRLGFSGALWVTETGYPSRAEHQWDPAMKGGDVDQVRWMARGPRQIMAGGAAVVFVAFRDSPEFGPLSPYASEGVVGWPDATPKPAYWALRTFAATPLPRSARGAAGDADGVDLRFLHGIAEAQPR